MCLCLSLASALALVASMVTALMGSAVAFLASMAMTAAKVSLQDYNAYCIVYDALHVFYILCKSHDPHCKIQPPFL